MPADGVVMADVPKGVQSGKFTVYPFGKKHAPWSWDLDLKQQQQTSKHVGVQSRMKNLGFYTGALDGDFGPRSKALGADSRKAAIAPQHRDCKERH